MATRCVTGIKGRTYRLVKLDVCGAPVTGAGSVVVSKFVKIDAAYEYEAGEEFLLKAADGFPCVNEKDDPFLKRVTTTVDACGIDPDGTVIVTGETLITTGSPVTGTGVAYGGVPTGARFSIEVWQNVSGSDACDASGAQQYLYLVYFNMGATTIGNYSIELAPSQFQFISESKPANAAWGDGPGSLASGLPAGFNPAGKHWAHNVTSTPPPTPVCGATALT